MIECTNYDEEAKARILANHLYFNGVPKKHIAAIVKDQGYREIIDHDNYNPRLIESMTSRIEIGALKPKEYLAAFLARLDDPSRLWEHIYEEQLSEASRHVLLALAAADAPARLSRLEQDFEALFGKRGREFGWTQRPNDFERSLNELEGNFLRIQDGGGQRIVEWHNPSVLDFLESWLRRHKRDTEALLDSASRFDQIETLTNTVDVLAPREEQAGEIRPAEAMLADAIGRTCVNMTWRQLPTAIRLAKRFSEGPVRDRVLVAARKLFESADIEVEDIPLAIAAIEQMQTCGWIDQTQVASWGDRLKFLLLCLDEGSFDQLEDFVPLAEWARKNRSRLTAEEFKAVQERSSRVVKSRMDVWFSPNRESIWVEMKESVENLQELLSMDFSQEIEAIEKRIEAAEKPESSSDEVGQTIQPPSASTVDSIFEALIQ